MIWKISISRSSSPLSILRLSSNILISDCAFGTIHQVLDQNHPSFTIDQKIRDFVDMQDKYPSKMLSDFSAGKCDSHNSLSLPFVRVQCFFLILSTSHEPNHAADQRAQEAQADFSGVW